MSGLGPNLQAGLDGVQDRRRGNHLFKGFLLPPLQPPNAVRPAGVWFWCGHFKIFRVEGGKKEAVWS